MPELFNAVDLQEQIAEVQREIAVRKRVYPRFVAQNNLTKAKAERQIAVMEAVLVTLRVAQSP